MQLDEQGLRVLVRWLLEQLAGKVDAAEGKGLSDVNFTEGYQAILEGQYAGAAPGLVPDGRNAVPGAFLRTDGTWAQVPDTQSDWEEQTESSPAFIQNKPFGRMVRVILPPQTVTTDAGGTAILNGDAAGVPESGELLVRFDGTEYTLQLIPAYDGAGRLTDITAGNRYFVTGNRADNTEEPLALVTSEGTIRLYTDAGRTHSIQAWLSMVRTLDPEWIGMIQPDSITDAEIDRLFAEAADLAEGG